jgi:uncharacterized protein (DUF305 family)
MNILSSGNAGAEGVLPSRSPRPTDAPPDTAAGPRFAGLAKAIARPAFLAALLTIAALALAAFAVATLVRDQPPGDGSADAGFARDMSIHHAQAVDMAAIVYRRTEDPLLRTLAFDILTTQQAQIGMMWGWLDVWELPIAGPDAPMTWLGDAADAAIPGMKAETDAATGGDGHTMTGRMPGLATAEEVASLSTLPVPEMEIEFLRLMIRHHQGGVAMAEAAVDRADTSLVRDFARGIVEAQSTEIALMEGMLAERGE